MDISELRERHPEHWMKAAALRVLAMDAVQAANSGHPGMPMGMADVATVLYERHLKFDAGAPDWPDRDRFVLSAGHGSMLLYGLLYLTGYAHMTMDEIRRFRQLGSHTEGHPEYGEAPGIETTTGPLGQGLANSVGMAIAEESLAARFGRKVVDHHTYVIAGDGCLMEGISHEAIALAGKQKLSRLIVFWDNNGISIDGKVVLSDVTDQRKRFDAAGWSVHACDGHDPDDIERAIVEAKQSQWPAFVDCRTHIGFGAPTKQDTKAAHGSPLGPEEIAKVREIYGWTSPPFEVPREILDAWRATGARGAAARADWEARLGRLSGAKQAEFARVVAGDPPKKLGAALAAFRKATAEAAPKVATRKSSEMVLEVVNAVMPETLGGSADLTGSNNTLTKGLGVFDADNRAGRYIHYGIREHGMAAAMNGIAVHGGSAPYGGTFLVFSDYARGAMRLSALMGVRVVYVLTHDSIGLGEDGPTHQPVEHLAMLRATPNLNVFRPADTVETAEAWELALTTRGDAVGAGADAAEPADGADAGHPAEPDGQGRLRAGGGGGAAAGDPARDRVGGGDRARGAGAARAQGDRDAGGVDALLGAVRGAGREVPQERAAGGAGAGGGGGGGAVRLGPLALRRARGGEEGRVRRDDRLRGVGADRGALPALRDHRGGGGGEGGSAGLTGDCRWPGRRWTTWTSTARSC